jgi:DNA-binding CsgD family transcriptional regulator
MPGWDSHLPIPSRPPIERPICAYTVMYTPITQERPDHADVSTNPDPRSRGDSEPLAWVLFAGHEIPEGWRSRARQVQLVPLLPEELSRLFEERDPGEDDDLLKLVAGGSSTEQIARSLDLSRRTVERHLARLRDRFDQPTTAALSSFLARRGF